MKTNSEKQKGAKPWVLNTGCQTLGAKHWVLNYVCNTLGAKLMWVLMIWVLYNGGKTRGAIKLGCKTMCAIQWAQNYGC